MKERKKYLCAAGRRLRHKLDGMAVQDLWRREGGARTGGIGCFCSWVCGLWAFGNGLAEEMIIIEKNPFDPTD